MRLDHLFAAKARTLSFEFFPPKNERLSYMCRDQVQRDFARWLRNEPTAAEKLLWHFLRGGK